MTSRETGIVLAALRFAQNDFEAFVEHARHFDDDGSLVAALERDGVEGLDGLAERINCG